MTEDHEEIRDVETRLKEAEQKLRKAEEAREGAKKHYHERQLLIRKLMVLFGASVFVIIVVLIALNVGNRGWLGEYMSDYSSISFHYEGQRKTERLTELRMEYQQRLDKLPSDIRSKLASWQVAIRLCASGVIPERCEEAKKLHKELR